MAKLEYTEFLQDIEDKKLLTKKESAAVKQSCYDCLTLISEHLSQEERNIYKFIHDKIHVEYTDDDMDYFNSFLNERFEVVKASRKNVNILMALKATVQVDFEDENDIYESLLYTMDYVEAVSDKDLNDDFVQILQKNFMISK